VNAHQYTLPCSDSTVHTVHTLFTWLLLNMRGTCMNTFKRRGLSISAPECKVKARSGCTSHYNQAIATCTAHLSYSWTWFETDLKLSSTALWLERVPLLKTKCLVGESVSSPSYWASFPVPNFKSQHLMPPAACVGSSISYGAHIPCSIVFRWVHGGHFLDFALHNILQLWHSKRKSSSLEIDAGSCTLRLEVLLLPAESPVSDDGVPLWNVPILLHFGDPQQIVIMVILTRGY
jgi:hypothetical protein